MKCLLFGSIQANALSKDPYADNSNANNDDDDDDEEFNLITKLYQPQQLNSFVDFAVDENGLWSVFGLKEDNNTVVLKVRKSPLTVYTFMCM